MRPLLLLLPAFVIGLALSAQPGDPSLFPPRLRLEPSIRLRLEPSITHEPSRMGPSSPVIYQLTDTIVLRITGHVKLDGGCGGGTPLYGFQRKEGDTWSDYIQPGMKQMCCGMSSAFWHEQIIVLIPAHSLSRPSGMAQPLYSRPWVPGEYRVVLALADNTEHVGPAFLVVEGDR